MRYIQCISINIAIRKHWLYHRVFACYAMHTSYSIQTVSWRFVQGGRYGSFDAFMSQNCKKCHSIMTFLSFLSLYWHLLVPKRNEDTFVLTFHFREDKVCSFVKKVNLCSWFLLNWIFNIYDSDTVHFPVKSNTTKPHASLKLLFDIPI